VSETHRPRTTTVRSSDGTVIAYHSMGHGPGLVVVGGVLSAGSDYMTLADVLADEFEVHVMERRGRPGSGPQRQDHSLEDECADLAAVAADTGAVVAFGHSFGGLVVLETARRQPVFREVFVYEPGVPIRGRLHAGWLDDYQRRLEHGDRRGAFASMVKAAGFAPWAVAIMPIWYLRWMLRIAIRGQKWATMDRLLEANLVEHRLQAELDAPSPERFSTVSSRTVLLGGTKSPDSMSGPLLDEIAVAIPCSEVVVLPGLGHLAPQQQADRVASAVLAHRAPQGPINPRAAPLTVRLERSGCA
jgi:pimeloyl-ACP methyl ester carboxylesterase